MIYDLLAKIVLLTHLTFIVFVVFGGFFVLRRPRLAWMHLPALAWGIVIESAGWICPLTPLENLLRVKANLNGYAGGFLEHLLNQLIYPLHLTRRIQLTMVVLLLIVNLGLYGCLWMKVNKRANRSA